MTVVDLTPLFKLTFKPDIIEWYESKFFLKAFYFLKSHAYFYYTMIKDLGNCGYHCLSTLCFRVVMVRDSEF